MDDKGVGRAIFPGTAPSPAPEVFSAKQEPLEGRIACELAAMGIKDLRIASAWGERMLFSRDQAEIPRFLKEIMFRSMPEVVVQPRSVDAVAAVLRFAALRGVVVIPRGSGSSPFGGSVPVKGGIVMDLSDMDRILEIDSSKKVARVEGGARWADLDHELEKHGLMLNTSPSSKFSTVAGWIATGGMGLNSFSRGHISASVREIELVTSAGEVARVQGSDKLFPSLFGSEGQLGIITSVALAVAEKPKVSKPHLVCFSDFRSAFSFAYALANSEVRPTHIVYESRAKFALINRMLGTERLRTDDAILLNVEGEASEAAFQGFMKSTGVEEEKEYLARYMWNERYFPMKVRKFGPGMLGSEVVVPLPKLAEVISGANGLCAKLGIDPLFEVHFLNDGNGLLLCYYVTDQGNTIRLTMAALKSMLLTSLMLDLGASPYSIGIWNHAFSGSEDKQRVANLRQAKATLDPNGVMNSGKYFALSGRLWGAAGLMFSPKLMRPALKTLRVFSPLTVRLMNMVYGIAERRLRPKTRTELLRIADECAMCGACIGVCPAYLVVGDERVTARGKLLTAKAMARGSKITKEHADRTFLCMRCKACEQICQSKLHLIDAFDVLEKELERMHGRDAQEIERFVKYAEGLPEYDRLIERGLVIGAPKHGMGGGDADV